MHGAKARVARASRIFVEGRHDAELVERVWGDDLRTRGRRGRVPRAASTTWPGTCATSHRARSAGSACWSTTSSPGSKESRIADEVRRSPVGQHVLVVGHPYVDVWAAVKPERLGLEQWPDVPRNEEWKKGVCRRLGWPHATQADIARAWKHILGRVTSYADLEPALLGRVEELIDFVTQP